jgi:hypothetical protein
MVAGGWEWASQASRQPAQNNQKAALRPPFLWA